MELKLPTAAQGNALTNRTSGRRWSLLKPIELNLGLS